MIWISLGVNVVLIVCVALLARANRRLRVSLGNVRYALTIGAKLQERRRAIDAAGSLHVGHT